MPSNGCLGLTPMQMALAAKDTPWAADQQICFPIQKGHPAFFFCADAASRGDLETSWAPQFPNWTPMGFASRRT